MRYKVKLTIESLDGFSSYEYRHYPSEKQLFNQEQIMEWLVESVTDTLAMIEEGEYATDDDER